MSAYSSMFPPSNADRRVLLVHSRKNAYSRAIYPPFFEAVGIVEQSGLAVDVIGVDAEEQKTLADSVCCRIPSLFRVSADGSVGARHEGRYTAEEIAVFIHGHQEGASSEINRH